MNGSCFHDIPVIATVHGNKIKGYLDSNSHEIIRGSPVDCAVMDDTVIKVGSKYHK